MRYYGLEWESLDSYFQMKEISAPDTPPANELRLYAKDKAGVSALYYKNDAGTEVDLSGGITGTGVNGRVAFWTGTLTLSSDSGLVWDSTNDRLAIGSAVAPTVSLDIRGTGATTGVSVERNDGQGSFAGYRVKGSANAANELLAYFGGGGSHTGLTADRLVTSLLGVYSGETWGGSAKGSYLTLETTPLLSTTRSERVRVDPNGILITGGGAVQSGTTQSGNIEMHPPTGVGASVAAIAIGFGVAGFGNFQGRSSRGTSGSPTATQLDDVIARFSAVGYGATAYAGAFRAAMSLLAAENWTDSAQGTYSVFHTTPTGSTTSAERLRIGPAGQVGIGGATFGTSGNLLRSNGSAAAVSWQDHTLDFLTQYALLAGRSGGQTLAGGTAAADDLVLKATTGNGVGSEAISFVLGNDGATKFGEFGTEGSTKGFRLFVPAGSQFNLTFKDGTTDKWTIFKTTNNELQLYDHVSSSAFMRVNPNSSLTEGRLILVNESISTSSVNVPGVIVAPTRTGSGDSPQGLAISPLFTPTSSIGNAYGYLAFPNFNPGSSVTITNAYSFYSRIDTGSGAGAVSTAFTGYFSNPNLGSLKPATIYGVFIANQGVSGMTNAVGLNINAQSGATNNWDMSFGRVDTTAAGAYYGRIPVLYNGLTKYIHVFS